MDLNFELILFYAVLVSGIVVLLARFMTSKQQETKVIATVIEYARSFFPILLFVFVLRSFAYEPFRIPSGSLKPTLLIGDFILVNKFNYGITLPVIHKKIIHTGEPKRGDIIVFRGPPSDPRHLIKRLIGIPGDHISYKNKVLYINGKEMTQHFEKYTTDEENGFGPWEVAQKQEDLSGVVHQIFQIPDRGDDDFDVIVPEHKYFMMGDNRDDSADSRVWGFLPEENIIGKASFIWLSVDSLKHPLRWDRIGSVIR